MDIKRSYLNQMDKELNFIQLFFEIFGLQYFSFTKLSDENVNKRPSVIQFFIMIIRLAVKVVFIVFFLVDMRRRSEIMTNVLMSALQLAMDIGVVLVICSSVLSSYFTTRKIKKFYLIFNDILYMINGNFSSQFQLKRFKKLIYFRLVMIWLSFSGLFYVAADFGKSDIFFCLSYFPLFYLVLISFHFIFFVELLNQALLALSESVQDFDTSNKSMHFRRIMLGRLVEKTSDDIRKMKIIRRTYNKIYDSASLVNDSFGLTILLILLVVVIASTVSGYKILICFIEGEGMKILKMHC